MTEREKRGKITKFRTRYKDWEKDRRLRFNKTFDVLASLLPQYDPSKPFSKIEILQRSILLIEELQKEKKAFLAGNNMEILKTQEDLETSINTFRYRNEQLMEVLRKSKIPIPEFNTKNTWIRNYKLDSKIEEKFSKIKENNLNEINLNTTENKIIEFQRPKKYSKKLTGDEKEKVVNVKPIRKGKKKNETAQITTEMTTNSITTVTSSQHPPLMCLQIISNSLVVTTANTTGSNLDNNAVVASTSKPKSSSDSKTFSILTTPIMATGIFLPVVKLEPRKKSGVKKIKPHPVEVAGKLPIPPLGKKIKPTRDRKRKNEITVTDKKIAIPEKKKKIEILKPKEGNETEQKENGEVEASTSVPAALTITLPSTSDLTNDIFENLRVPQSGSNGESLSPTAAYLLNFPIVSSKMTDEDGGGSENPNQDVIMEPTADNGKTNSNSNKEEKTKSEVIKNENITKSEILLEENLKKIFSDEKETGVNKEEIVEPIISSKLNQLSKKEEIQARPIAEEKSLVNTIVTKNSLEPSAPLVVQARTSFAYDLPTKNPITTNEQLINLQSPFVTKEMGQITDSTSFTFSLTSTTSSYFTPNTSLQSITTPTFVPKVSFDFLSNTNYPPPPGPPASSTTIPTSTINLPIKPSLDESYLNYSSKSTQPTSSFTFSLTNPTTTSTSYSQSNLYTNQNQTAISTGNKTSTTSFPNFSFAPPPPSIVTTPNTNYNNYPFTFDNNLSLSNANPVVCSINTTTIGTNFTFSLTNSSGNQSKYTTCSTYNTFNPFSTNPLEQNGTVNNNNNNSVNNYPVNSGVIGYEANYLNRNLDEEFTSLTKMIKTPTKKTSNNPKPSNGNIVGKSNNNGNNNVKYNHHQPVNWMMPNSISTSSSSQYKQLHQPTSDYSTILPPPSFDFAISTVPTTTITTSASSYYPPPIPSIDLNRKSDIFFAHPPGDDNFPWSPNKMSNILDGTQLNASHTFIPSTLPTLHGDLALSTPTISTMPAYVEPNNKTQNNFFSVSQLVDNQPSTHNIENNSNSTSQSAIKSKSSSSKTNNILKPTSKKYNNYNTKQSNWNYPTDSVLNYDSNNANATISTATAVPTSISLPVSSIQHPIIPSTLAIPAPSNQKQSTTNIYSAEALIGHHITNPTNNSHQIHNHYMTTSHNNNNNLKKDLNNKFNRNFNDNFNPPSSDAYFQMDILSNNNNEITNPPINYNNFLYNNNNHNYHETSNSNINTNYYNTHSTDIYNNNNSQNTKLNSTLNNYKQYPVAKTTTTTTSKNIYHSHGPTATKYHDQNHLNRNMNNTKTSNIYHQPGPVSHSNLPNYDTITNASSYYHHQGSLGINSPMMSSIDDPTYHHLYHTPSSFHHQIPTSGSVGINNNNNIHTSGGSGGTSLANFNLSTICPEINDKVRWG